MASGTQTVSLREAGCHCERWHGPLPNLQTNGASVGYVEICDFLPACRAFLSTRVRSWSACCWSSWSSRNWEATLCIMAAATSLDRNSLTAWQCKQACNLPSIGARFTQTSLTRRKRAPAKCGLSGNPRAQTQVKARDLGTESAQARKIWATKTKSQRVNGFKHKEEAQAGKTPCWRALARATKGFGF